MRMKAPPLIVSWVDIALLMVVIAGIYRGRKRGMSEELLDVIKWVSILVLAAFVTRPAGQMLAQSSVFSLLSCYICVYTTLIIAMKVFFGLIRKRIGDKLVSSDFFGGAEYYLGMVAGAFRYLCVIVVVLAFINARYYSPEEIADDARVQQQNFGDIRFPTWAALQNQVFNHSMAGAMARDFVPLCLIPPTAPETKALGGDSVVRARERTVERVLDRR